MQSVQKHIGSMEVQAQKKIGRTVPATHNQNVAPATHNKSMAPATLHKNMAPAMHYKAPATTTFKQLPHAILPQS
ncbi:unnamed protein product [Trifolium pratense]|uniref:Uncharacterized protein n=1 Tax=Trifolium pratense TaxID=57577 RepID=A0ACB0J5Z0_TRIPR|nr:unnamed protein product [Trifolium pratense]